MHRPSAHYDTISISTRGRTMTDLGSSRTGCCLKSSSVSIHSTYVSSCSQGKTRGSSVARICPRIGEKKVNASLAISTSWCRQCLWPEDVGKLNIFPTNTQLGWLTIAALSLDLSWRHSLEVIRLPHVTSVTMNHSYNKSMMVLISGIWFIPVLPYHGGHPWTYEHHYLVKVCKLTIGTLASMAKLHPHLSRMTSTSLIKGHVLSYPSQFSVQIENNRHTQRVSECHHQHTDRESLTNQFVLMISIPTHFPAIGRRQMR